MSILAKLARMGARSKAATIRSAPNADATVATMAGTAGLAALGIPAGSSALFATGMNDRLRKDAWQTDGLTLSELLSPALHDHLRIMLDKQSIKRGLEARFAARLSGFEDEMQRDWRQLYDAASTRPDRTATNFAMNGPGPEMFYDDDEGYRKNAPGKWSQR